MTNPSPHLPRRLLVAAGLLATGLALVRDRDLAALPALARAVRTHESPAVDPAPVDTPTQRLRAALQAHQPAEQAFSEAFEGWLAEQPVDEAVTGPGHPSWAPYWTLRDAVAPAYAASLERLAADAMALAAEEPDNGVFEVVAGLADVVRATSPGPMDALDDTVAQADEELVASWLRLDDPALLARGLARLDAGLGRSAFTLRNQELLAARLDPLEGTPVRRLVQHLGIAYQVELPELMFLRAGARHLVRLARAERLAGRPGEPHLGRARRLALRQGGEATFLIELLVAQATLREVDEGWHDDAAARGDVAQARAAAAEQQAVLQRRERARRLSEVLNFERLGEIDAMLMPVGGWDHRSGFDPALGRAADHAVLESLVLLALLLLGGLGLGVAWLQARRGGAAHGAAAGWTLGDALAVALPSFGAVAVFTLLHTRLHPARGLGLGAAGGLQVALLQAAALVFIAGYLFAWLLRARCLARHGLELARPTLARAGLWLALGGAHVALLWVTAREQELLPLAGALLLAGVAAAWRGGAFGRASADPAVAAAVRGYEGRVGLATLGLALALVAAVECVLVAPRRDRLVRAYEAQARHLIEHEAELWGGPDDPPQRHLRQLLEDSPDAPG
ncbi:MAG: hypothetical protein M9894_29830 [Planctomycetes bacterium]|nr:hypothetical protein [Planctomycetota bacterium]